MTWVNEDTQPQYPEHCDVIDSWCFSLETPRCPKEILDSLNSFQTETAYNWSSMNEKQKSGTIHRFLKKLKNEIENPKRKTDNILMILLNGMKMIRVPQDYIDKVKEYIRTKHIQVKDAERFKTMETSKIYSDVRFFDIVGYIFNIIASGKESEYTYDPNKMT